MKQSRVHPLKRLGAASLTVAALLFSASMALANDKDHDEPEHDRVLHEVESGRLKSLGELRHTVLARVDGTIVDIDLDREHGKTFYEFRVLRSDGRVVEVEIDGHDGRILEVEND